MHEKGKCIGPKQVELISIQSFDFQIKVVQSKGWLSAVKCGLETNKEDNINNAHEIDSQTIEHLKNIKFNRPRNNIHK